MSPSGTISEAMVEAFKAKYREFWPGAWPPDGPMSKEMHEVLRASILAALSSSPVGEMDADLFWDDENPEESYRDVEDIFDAIGEAATYLKVRRAKSLPDAWVSCVLEDEDASNWTITYHENEESARKTVQDARTALASEGVTPKLKWIDWKGGECPLPHKTHIEFSTRALFQGTSTAGAQDWHHSGSAHDIMSYRLLPETGGGR